MHAQLRVVVLALILAPCLAFAQESEAYGQKPDQEQAQELALDVLKGLLKDPYSAHIEWSEIVGTSRWQGAGQPCFGWVLFAKINAKNAYGGYVGARDYRFFIRDDRVDCVITTKHRTARSWRDVEMRVY